MKLKNLRKLILNGGYDQEKEREQASPGEILYFIAHKNANDVDSAIQYYSRKIKRDPIKSIFYEFRARLIEFKAGHYLDKTKEWNYEHYLKLCFQARDDRKEVIKLDPNPIAYYNYGLVHIRLSDFSTAFSYLNRAIEIGFKKENIEDAIEMREQCYRLALI